MSRQVLTGIVIIAASALSFGCPAFGELAAADPAAVYPSPTAQTYIEVAQINPFSVLNAIVSTVKPPKKNPPANDQNQQPSNEQNPPTGDNSAPDTSAGPNEGQPVNQKPIIHSVTPIAAVNREYIVITGSGFGNAPPQINPIGDGSVATLACSTATPSLAIRNNRAGNGWAAGRVTCTNFDSLGIIPNQDPSPPFWWSDNEIVLWGFGSALGGPLSISRPETRSVLLCLARTTRVRRPLTSPSLATRPRSLLEPSRSPFRPIKLGRIRVSGLAPRTSYR